MTQKITNAEEVTGYFGYWPEFCDAKVEKLTYKLPGVVELSVLYIDVALKKRADIGLRFTGVTEMELNELRSENVVDKIKIEAGSPFVVSIEAAFGLCGQFACTNISVIYVRV